MGKRWASRPADLKLDNKSAIIQHVYLNGVTSKSDICSVLGLSKPTTSSLIDELVSDKVLRSVGLGTSTGQGGKRPELFDFNDDARSVIGLQISSSSVRGILTNLRLKCLKTVTRTASRHDFGSVFAVVCNIVEQFLQEAEQGGDRVLGIGVSAPGMVDPAAGIIIHTVYPEEWSNVPIGYYLRQRYELPTFVDNESRNIALAEKWLGIGVAEGVSNFITLQTEDGLGTGVVLGGTASLGPEYGVGQFGHTTINFDGPLCKCGNKGCWQLYATEHAFLNAVEEAADKWGLPSSLIDNLHPGTRVSIPLVAHYFHLKDEFARTQVELYVQRLAVGIVNLVNAFSPEWIVLHGNLTVFGSEFLGMLSSVVRTMALPPAADRVRIVFSDLGALSAALGASTSVVRAAFDERLLFQE